MTDVTVVTETVSSIRFENQTWKSTSDNGPLPDRYPTRSPTDVHRSTHSELGIIEVESVTDPHRGD